MSDRPSNPRAHELRAAAKDFREREIRLRGYDGASAGMCERAADEIDRLTKHEAELVSALTVAVRRLAAVRNAILDRQPPAVWDSEIEQARAALKEQP